MYKVCASSCLCCSPAKTTTVICFLHLSIKIINDRCYGYNYLSHVYTYISFISPTLMLTLSLIYINANHVH